MRSPRLELGWVTPLDPKSSASANFATTALASMITLRMPGLYILFDGYCNLCDGFVAFAMQRDRRGVLRFVPTQSEEGLQLLRESGQEQGQASVVFIENGRLWRASDAALRVFAYLDWPWNWVSWLRILPKGLRDFVYAFVARLRYRLFGVRTVCAITRTGKGPRA